VSADEVADGRPVVGVPVGDGVAGGVVVGVLPGLLVLGEVDDGGRGVDLGLAVALRDERGALLAEGVGVGLDATGGAGGGRTYR